MDDRTREYVNRLVENMFGEEQTPLTGLVQLIVENCPGGWKQVVQEFSLVLLFPSRLSDKHNDPLYRTAVIHFEEFLLNEGMPDAADKVERWWWSK